jgi:hypothetical protein
MNENKKLEYLRILKDMCNKNEINGSISNNMYSYLRRRFPWHFLMFSWKNKSENVTQVHKELIINQYNTRLEYLMKFQLTQNDIEELELIHESLDRICFRKENTIEKSKSFQEWEVNKKKTIDLLIEVGAKKGNKKGSILFIK